jgi:putative membrane protein
MKWFVGLSALLGLALGPAVAQTMQAPTVGAMSSTDVGMEPMMRVAGPLYAKLSLTNEIRTIEAARRAAASARSDATRATAMVILREHQGALRELSRIAAIATQLPAARSSARGDLALLGDSAERFAQLQLAWQRHAWALHSGYAADGRDPALRRFARDGVMRAERDLRRLPMRPMAY